MEENYIYFTDEDGTESPYEMWDVIEYEGVQYAVLLPADADEADEEDNIEVTILKLVSGDDDQFDFEDVQSDEVLDAVFAIFLEHMDEEDEEE